MKMLLERTLTLLAICFVAQPVLGQKGIASKYPHDKGIKHDPAVVFCEDFDTGDIESIAKRWESVEHKEILSLSTDTPSGEMGGQRRGRSLLMTHVGGKGHGAHLYRRLQPGYEKLHVRFYVKFDQDCAQIHHFFYVGGYNPATSWPQGGAGHRPRADKRFSTGVEPHGEAWVWDYYTYWADMRGSPPRGQPWGNSFIRDRRLKVQREKWICVELMMKMNDVGDSNGEMALWIDGRPVSKLGKGFPKGKWFFDKFTPNQGGKGIRWNDATGKSQNLEFPPGGTPFEGFRWRSDERLKLNFLWVLLYITKAPKDHVSKVRFDNIVVAKDYIGPISIER